MFSVYQMLYIKQIIYGPFDYRDQESIHEGGIIVFDYDPYREAVMGFKKLGRTIRVNKDQS